METKRFKRARKRHKSEVMNTTNGSCNCKLFTEQFSKIDMYGMPIRLTYKGSYTFGTSWGACLTILTVLGIVWVTASVVAQVVFQPAPKLNQVTQLINPSLYDS